MTFARQMARPEFKLRDDIARRCMMRRTQDLETKN